MVAIFNFLSSLGAMLFGTESGTRTHTVLPPPDFESGASTSFATSAFRSEPTKVILRELSGSGLTIFVGIDFNIVEGGRCLISLWKEF